MCSFLNHLVQRAWKARLYLYFVVGLQCRRIFGHAANTQYMYFFAKCVTAILDSQSREKLGRKKFLPRGG